MISPLQNQKMISTRTKSHFDSSEQKMVSTRTKNDFNPTKNGFDSTKNGFSSSINDFLQTVLLLVLVHKKNHVSVIIDAQMHLQVRLVNIQMTYGS